MALQQMSVDNTTFVEDIGSLLRRNEEQFMKLAMQKGYDKKFLSKIGGADLDRLGTGVNDLESFCKKNNKENLLKVAAEFFLCVRL